MYTLYYVEFNQEQSLCRRILFIIYKTTINNNRLIFGREIDVSIKYIFEKRYYVSIEKKKMPCITCGINKAHILGPVNEY